MAQMIRKQIYIDADDERFLKERSSELGITEAEVVRQALAGAKEKARSDESIQALERLMNYIREHRMRDVPQTDSASRWTFNREEIYDEMYEERFEEPRRRREEARARSKEAETV